MRIARTNIESEFLEKYSECNEIKIFAKESRNYNINAEKEISEFTTDVVRNWTPNLMFLENPEALCTLEPESCTVTEELNGTYEATFTAKVDDFFKYKSIIEYNYALIHGQLFFIYKINYNNLSSKQTIQAYCLHVSYLLNNYQLLNVLDMSKFVGEFQLLGENSLFYIRTSTTGESKFDADLYLNRAYAMALEQTKYYKFENQSFKINFADKNYFNCKFKIRSNIKRLSDKYTQDINGYIDTKPTGRGLLNLIIDGENSVAEVTGGEIYRFNFYISLKEKKEDAREDAFYFTIGNDQKNIKREVDYSNFCTDFLYQFKANGQKKINIVYIRAKKTYGCKTRIFKTAREDFGSGSPNYDQGGLFSANQYFNSHFYFKIKYIISFFSTLEEVEGFSQTTDYRVGDTGYIYDSTIGGSIKAKITKIVKDGITGQINSIMIECKDDYSAPNNHQYFLSTDEFVNYVSPSRMAWNDVAEFKWAEITLRNWNELRGE